MIENFGLPEYVAIKRRIVDAIEAGAPPSALAAAQDRYGRTGIRIALRQLKASGPASPVLKAWLAAFDYAALEDDGDEAVLRHAH